MSLLSLIAVLRAAGAYDVLPSCCTWVVFALPDNAAWTLVLQVTQQAGHTSSTTSHPRAPPSTHTHTPRSDGLRPDPETDTPGLTGTGGGEAEPWARSEYFEQLLEHASRGLVLLGAPLPTAILAQLAPPPPRGWWERAMRRFGFWRCCRGAGDEADEEAEDTEGRGGSGGCLCLRLDAGEPDPAVAAASRQLPPGVPPGMVSGVELSEGELAVVRELLLLLLVAAEQYLQRRDAAEYVRLLTFVARVCVFFRGCGPQLTGSTAEPLNDIRAVAEARMHEQRKASKAQVQAQ